MKKNYYKIILFSLLVMLFTNKGFAQTERAIFKQKIVASDRTAGDNYGVSMATSGNYAIVGATNISSAGSVYILEKNTSTGVWAEKQKLKSADWAAADYFGYAVAIKGDTAIVGAPNKAYTANMAPLIGTGTTLIGAVYIFIRNSTSGVWEEKQKLTSSNPIASAAFGFSVAVEKDLILVGASSEKIEISSGNTTAATGTGIATAGGAAYVFRGTAGVWSQEQRVVADDRVGNGKFGASVALKNGIAFIGSSGATVGTTLLSGAVYVLTSSANVWTQIQKLNAITPNSAASFGYSLSANGDYLLIGALQQTYGSSTFFGSAFVFKNTAGTWAKVQEITGIYGLLQGRFGVSVALNDDFILIGEQAAALDVNGANSLTGAGAAHLFKKDIGVDNWTLLNRFTAPNRLAADNFGVSVALGNGTDILVGAFKEDEDAAETNTLTDAGSIYAFKAEVPAVLPVSLVNYSAKLVNDGTVELSWFTSAEQNNHYFVVERSLDGKTFSSLGSILSKGNKGSAYSFKDLTPLKGTNYYRLSQVDGDGIISYLGIKEVSVSFSVKKAFTVVPNPVTGNLVSLSISSPSKTIYKVALVDLSSKRIFDGLVTLTNSELQFTIPSVTPGTYIISVESLGSQTIIIK